MKNEVSRDQKSVLSVHKTAPLFFHHVTIFKSASILLTFLFFGLSGCFSLVYASGDVSVKAELSRPEIYAGEMTELQVKVTGAEVADVPRQIDVEGLQIRLTGQSTQVQMVNFKVSSSAVYSYIIMPLRTGHFTIPSIPVRSNAGVMQTAPLAFSVIESSGNTTAASGSVPNSSLPLPQPGMPGFQGARPSAQRSGGPDLAHLAFGEIICPKKKIYLGEMVPVEIRYYFDAHCPVQVKGRVDFGSEGILVERFSDPKESREERDGMTYNVLTFRTLISAVKPGSVDIAPAKLDSQIQIASGLSQGMDDPNSQQQILQQLLGGQSPFTQTRDLKVKTAPLHLEILPLPKEGKPASFAGAVGQFDIDAVIANPKPAPGDPVVLTVKVGGKGNFKAMGAPVLTETEGWRSYPPADKFESTDQLSYTGVKSFDFTLIAQEKKTNSPASEFSYFDPILAKFVTLTTQPLPLRASPLAATPVAATALLQPTAEKGSTPIPKENPLSVKNENNGIVSTITLHAWKTPSQRSEFLVATLAMFLSTTALAALLYFRNLQSQNGSSLARRRRLAELWALLNTETLDASATYDAALEYLDLLETSESEHLMEELTSRRDLLKYGVGGSVALGRDERAKLIEGLRKFSKP